MQLLKRLSEAPGIPGREDEVRKIIIGELEDVVDEIKTDVLGNVIGKKVGAGDGPTIMLAAHMDEIGFFVKHIDEDKGFLKIEPLGGFDDRVLLAQRVIVHGQEGDYLGSVGSKPVHIMEKEEKEKRVKIKNLFVDLGMETDEVKEKVKVGDPITLRQEFVEGEKVVTGKALDDRAGIYVVIEALKKVKHHLGDVYLVATTQEEVGLRGARTSGYEISPDVGIACDVTLACDVPEVKRAEYVTELGKGCGIKIKDSASISNPKLVNELRSIAEKRDIKYQLEILPGGGTDAGGMQLTKEGVACGTISIPTRYIHTVVETAHKEDIQSCIDLIAAYLEEADHKDYNL